jgi:hypothetical protein
MELSFGDDSSDKDNKMKNSLESSDSTTEKKQEKSEKKPVKKNIPLFRMLDAESDAKPKEKQSDVVEAPDAETGILGMIKKASEREKENKAEVDEVQEDALVSESNIEDVDQNEESEPNKQESKLDEISSDEITEVVNSYINVGMEDSKQQLNESEPDSVEAAEEAASITFLEALKDKIDVDNQIEEDDIQKIANQVSEQISEGHDEETPSEGDEVTNTELEQDIANIDSEDDEENNPVSNSTNSAGGSTAAPAPPSPPVPPVNRSTGASGSGGAGAVNLPPIGGGATGGGNPNYNATVPPNPNAVNSPIEYSINRRRAGDFLVGGIIGYLIGKRRGRIKAEKNLLPIQDKLEKQVIGLQSKLYEQEERVRQVAATKFENNIIIAPPENNQKTKSESKPKEKESTIRIEESINREKIDNIINDKPEISRDSRPEAEQKEKRLNPKSVEIMSLPMILGMAESIEIGNTSLKRLYENGEIDQQQLREVVKKHIRGERIDQLVGEFVGEKSVTQERLKDDFEKEDANSSSSRERNGQAGAMVDFGVKNTSEDNTPAHENTNNVESFNGVTPDDQENKPSLMPIYVTAVMAVIVAVIIIILFT